MILISVTMFVALSCGQAIARLHPVYLMNAD